MERQYVVSALIAAILAFVLAVAEFWYAGRLSFVHDSRSFKWYVGIQAIVGAAAFLGLDFLIEKKYWILGNTRRQILLSRP